MNRRGSRRDFLLQSALAGAAGPLLVGQTPGAAQEQEKAKTDSPNGRVRIACIGVGGKGDSDSTDAGKFGEIVALSTSTRRP